MNITKYLENGAAYVIKPNYVGFIPHKGMDTNPHKGSANPPEAKGYYFASPDDLKEFLNDLLEVYTDTTGDLFPAAPQYYGTHPHMVIVDDVGGIQSVDPLVNVDTPLSNNVVVRATQSLSEDVECVRLSLQDTGTGRYFNADELREFATYLSALAEDLDRRTERVAGEPISVNVPARSYVSTDGGAAL